MAGEGPFYSPEHHAVESIRNIMQRRIDALEHEKDELKVENAELKTTVVNLAKCLVKTSLQEVDINQGEPDEPVPPTAA